VLQEKPRKQSGSLSVFLTIADIKDMDKIFPWERA
jgi:hypothetical protein